MTIQEYLDDYTRDELEDAAQWSTRLIRRWHNAPSSSKKFTRADLLAVFRAEVEAAIVRKGRT